MIEVRPVSNPRDLKAFIDFPHDLYKENPNYVPELFIAQRDLLTPGKHPFHKHSSLQCFLLYVDGKVQGRIAAIQNNNHNAFNKANDGFFGFFDCVNNQQYASLLFQEAEKWLKERGLSTIIGPVNFSTNEACGLLIAGFDRPPYAMMTYNEPYYLQLIEKAGFVKKTDLIAYEFDQKDYIDRAKKVRDLLESRLKKKNIIIRSIQLKNFKEEVRQVHAIYNAAWDKNLGFVPMTEEEFVYLAKDLKMVLDPDFCMIAEENGKAIGFALAVPDINQILIKIKRGRLLPTGIFKLLLGRKKINAIRIIALGVLEPYRKMGIEACFYAEMNKQYLRKNMQHVEASWILEDNVEMILGITNSNGKEYKRYRIFEKAI